MFETLAVLLYFSLVTVVGVASYSRKASANDFIIGNRSLGVWLTALAAHASDMSSWLFMAYPAMIFTFGLSKAWIAVGLIVFMYCNWHYIARKIREASEKSKSVTFFSYLCDRFGDTSGSLRILTALVCFVCYTIYISAGLMGLGLVVESLFGISYTIAIVASVLLALPYVLIGGYRTLAWIDLFQGLFLMVVILAVPALLFSQVGGWEGIEQAASLQQISLLALPDFSLTSGVQALLIMLGWGLGYFGQPTIITKFMGIKDPQEISKSKIIGMSWMLLSLLAATLVGLIGIPFFQGSLANPEMVFISMVKESFHPFFIGLILCAVIAASINVLCSQILVLCSTLTEDIYKKLYNANATSGELLRICRYGAIGIGAVALFIAYFQVNSIYQLVLYAWSGLGASFGPLLIFSLYSKRHNKAIAWSAILSGGLATALWPLASRAVDPIIIGFIASFSSIWVATLVTEEKAPLTASL